MSMELAVVELLEQWRIECPEMYRKFLKMSGLSERKSEVRAK